MSGEREHHEEPHRERDPEFIPEPPKARRENAARAERDPKRDAGREPDTLREEVLSENHKRGIRDVKRETDRDQHRVDPENIMRQHGKRDRRDKEQAPDPDHFRVAEAVGERPPKERAEDAGKGKHRHRRARGGVRGPKGINAVERKEAIDPGVAGGPKDDKDREFRERLPVVRLRIFRDRRCGFHRLNAFVWHLDSGAEE